MKRTNEKTNEVSRRGFIGAIGAATAAAALPVGALAASPLTWPETLAAWPEAFRGLVERFRPLYVAEVARLAATLRPRFESGELHAMTDDELEDDAGAMAPIWRVQAAAGEHFGLVRAGGREGRSSGVEREERICDGAGHVAHMILAVSRSAPFMDEGWDHVAYQANEAAMWDVVLHARAAGWYTPGPTEQLGRNFAECRVLEAGRNAGVRS